MLDRFRKPRRNAIDNQAICNRLEYDADGNRVSRTRVGVTTYYAFGAWEQVGTNTKKLYSFGGRVVAQRDDSTNAVLYLHPDHQGGTLLVRS